MGLDENPSVCNFDNQVRNEEMDKNEEKIIDTLDQLTDDMIDFTCRLVAEPSTLENEASVLQVMEAELGRLSF